MVQRIQYRRRHSYNTRSNRVRVSVYSLPLKAKACTSDSQCEDSRWQKRLPVREEDEFRTQVR